MPTEGVILSGVFYKTRLYLDGSLENPIYGCRRCKQKENFCESLRQKDSEVFTVVFVLQKRLCTNAFALKLNLKRGCHRTQDLKIPFGISKMQIVTALFFFQQYALNLNKGR